MTQEQARLIREAWDAIVPDADAVATQFYENLFKIDPTAASLFSGTDMDRQRDVLVKALGFVVDHVDDAENLVPVLQEMGRRHVRYGVEESHYASVGAALVATLEQGLDSAFTEEVRAAWTSAYGLISDTMQKGACGTAAAAE